jgi:cob(I)alamin adenosyltransferase
VSITTKTGDGGETGLIGGRRVPKDHPLLECLGTIDELNAFLGDAGAAATAGETTAGTGKIIAGIQEELFTVSGILAGSGAPAPGEERLGALIEELEAGQPKFTAFRIPGAGPLSAKLHIARTVCRRAERRLVSLDRLGELPEGILPWFNRLSDLLFLLAGREENAGAAYWGRNLFRNRL